MQVAYLYLVEPCKLRTKPTLKGRSQIVLMHDYRIKQFGIQTGVFIKDFSDSIRQFFSTNLKTHFVRFDAATDIKVMRSENHRVIDNRYFPVNKSRGSTRIISKAIECRFLANKVINICKAGIPSHWNLDWHYL